MNKLLSNNKDKNAGNASKNSITGKISNVIEKGKETLNVVKEKGKEAANVVKEKTQNVSGQIKNVVKPEDKPLISNSMFTVDSITQKTTQFAESNTAITKFVFIIVLLLLTVVFFQLGSWLIQYFMGVSKSPILIDGLVSANKLRKISVNPNETESVPIYRSINEDQGIEFTWNVWYFVESLNPSKPTYSRIFSKGSENGNLNLSIPTDCLDDTCRHVFNSSPGLFITQNKQQDSVFPNSISPIKDQNNVNLILMLNTFQASDKNKQFAESITVENMPIQKWVCVTIRVQQTTVDIYINGTMTQRKHLNNLPRQNYYDVLVGDLMSGFLGSISSLRYFNHALAYDEIQSLYGKGPNLKSLEADGLMPNGVDYMSMNWYYKL
jgi:hypothetical protein